MHLILHQFLIVLFYVNVHSHGHFWIYIWCLWLPILLMRLSQVLDLVLMVHYLNVIDSICMGCLKVSFMFSISMIVVLRILGHSLLLINMNDLCVFPCGDWFYFYVFFIVFHNFQLFLFLFHFLLVIFSFLFLYFEIFSKIFLFCHP